MMMMMMNETQKRSLKYILFGLFISFIHNYDIISMNYNDDDDDDTIITQNFHSSSINSFI